MAIGWRILWCMVPFSTCSSGNQRSPAFPVLIAAVTAHIPNKGEQLVRCYGYYSNVSKGKRKKEKPAGKETVSWKPEVIEVVPPPISKELKKRWSHFIQKVYETHPLICPKCQGEMRIISFIDQPEVIKKILQHLLHSLGK